MIPRYGDARYGGSVQISDDQPMNRWRVGLKGAGGSTTPDEASTAGRRPRSTASPGSRTAGGFRDQKDDDFDHSGLI